MRGTARQTDDDATEDVGVESLLSLAFLEGLAPVAGRELARELPVTTSPSWLRFLTPES
jgi:hypothetical protein